MRSSTDRPAQAVDDPDDSIAHGFSDLLIAVQDAWPDATIVVDSDRRILSFNQAYVDLWQIPAGAIAIGLPAEPLLDVVIPHLADPQAYMAQIAELYSNPEAAALEEVRLRDGRILERYSRGLIPPSPRTEKEAGRIWIFRDITATKRREEKLEAANRALAAREAGAEVAEAAAREAHDRLAYALDGANDGLWDWKVQTGEIYFSPRYLSMLGYQPGELLPHLSTLKALRHPEDAVGVAEKLSRHFDGLTEAHEAEFRMRHKDGRWIWIRARGKAVTRDASGAPTRVVGTHIDITRDKEREAELRTAKEAAEAASRVKTDFLANMSHELRTPLNAVIGFAEIMKTEVFGPLGADCYREYAADIQSSGEHLLAIINTILDMAKVEAGEVEITDSLIDLRRLIRPCLSVINERAARQELTITVELGADLPPIRVDVVRMKQVLINLLSNAVKFTPRQGTVTIAGNLVASGGIEIVVSDTGIGIAEADIPRALEPFGQVDGSLARRFEGTGLGLPLSKTLVELHGGTLTVTSTPGEGTRVTVLIPADRVVALPDEE
ncbi:MAG TPA: ATP-binding protein [Stellaceae bacterium]|nr:ATP-binding protein [Stellaceae bacterium]